VKIIVTRAFVAGGKVHKVGSSVELPDRVAAELFAMNKAMRAPSEPPPVAPGPLTTETAAGLVKGKAKGEPEAG
jgi:hypothetical protein